MRVGFFAVVFAGSARLVFTAPILGPETFVNLVSRTNDAGLHPAQGTQSSNAAHTLPDKLQIAQGNHDAHMLLDAHRQSQSNVGQIFHAAHVQTDGHHRVSETSHEHAHSFVSGNSHHPQSSDPAHTSSDKHHNTQASNLAHALKIIHHNVQSGGATYKPSDQHHKGTNP
ncbi:SubName: Full=Uncharacterized protein {ECO:0000313/EMBL:CCA75696.1} [Serendipita indica DSM 11827]|uniref:Uncharacterized protein n=1 Tax=Serendipita indica (strain DSM 11827) TaxID=1109443 RepID=G4TWK3_SERID|nr:SubName: Full=Uncharacterized protein {ECO:0000313/EMBL:CCA75696.1} [Serendipita indica DSM 11827]CCA75696.1 hypothetical protein PIIN_09686 [Serendipita indica DSM 11827]